MMLVGDRLSLDGEGSHGAVHKWASQEGGRVEEGVGKGGESGGGVAGRDSNWADEDGGGRHGRPRQPLRILLPYCLY